jgi:hypothetical protein
VIQFATVELPFSLSQLAWQAQSLNYEYNEIHYSRVISLLILDIKIINYLKVTTIYTFSPTKIIAISVQKWYRVNIILLLLFCVVGANPQKYQTFLPPKNGYLN